MLLIQNNYNTQLTRVLICVNKLVVSCALQTNMSFNPFRIEYCRLQHYQGSVDSKTGCIKKEYGIHKILLVVCFAQIEIEACL